MNDILKQEYSELCYVQVYVPNAGRIIQTNRQQRFSRNCWHTY